MEKPVNEKKLRHLEFINRETDNRHHTHTEDMKQYELLKIGSPDAVAEGIRMFSSSLPGRISDDLVKNYKYLFVASITLSSRAAIIGGLDAERAYNISDLYIRKMDTLKTVEEIKALHADMFAFYTKEMAELDKRQVYSKPIIQCMDYIYNHLHQKIHITDMAKQVKLNSSYLSTLFKKEVGLSISRYILSKRMEAARNMLKFSDYTYAEISTFLAFSSQSHFIRTFKRETGYTPKEYRSFKTAKK